MIELLLAAVATATAVGGWKYFGRERYRPPVNHPTIESNYISRAENGVPVNIESTRATQTPRPVLSTPTAQKTEVSKPIKARPWRDDHKAPASHDRDNNNSLADMVTGAAAGALLGSVLGGGSNNDNPSPRYEASEISGGSFGGGGSDGGYSGGGDGGGSTD